MQSDKAAAAGAGKSSRKSHDSEKSRKDAKNAQDSDSESRDYEEPRHNRRVKDSDPENADNNESDSETEDNESEKSPKDSDDSDSDDKDKASRKPRNKHHRRGSSNGSSIHLGVVNTKELPRLTGLTLKNITDFADAYTSCKLTFKDQSHLDLIEPVTKKTIYDTLVAYKVEDCDNWEKWEADVLLMELKKIMAPSSSTSVKTFEALLADEKFTFNYRQPNPSLTFLTRLNKHLSLYPDVDELDKTPNEPTCRKRLDKIISILYDCISRNKSGQGSYENVLRKKIERDAPSTIRDFKTSFQRCASALATSASEVQLAQTKRKRSSSESDDGSSDVDSRASGKRIRHSSGRDRRKEGGTNKPYKSNKTAGDSDKASPCKGCGKTHTGDCRYKSHPGYNATSKSWAHSDNGKAYLKQNFTTLHPSFLPDGKKYNRDSKHTVAATASTKTKKKDGKHPSVETDNHYIDVTIELPTNSVNSFALLDTGALQGNYIAADLADELLHKGLTITPSAHTCVVCSPLKSKKCLPCQGTLTIPMRFLNEVTNTYDTIKADFIKIDSTIPLIIGRPTILKNQLIYKLYNHFGLNTPTDTESCLTVDMGETKPSGGHPSRVTHSANAMTVARGTVKSKRELLDMVEDNDEADSFLKEYLFDVKDPDTLEGMLRTDPSEIDLRTQLEKVLSVHAAIFKTSVQPNPANLPPMEMDVDREKWFSNLQNRCSPRPQTPEKQEELIRQIKLMLANNVIRASQAQAWSHVLLTPKHKGGGYRFCIDYRLLNEATKGLGWPIPNIRELLQRLGRVKAKYFGVMDLTSGYHQAPLSAAARQFTAFTCVCGTYEWLRVPMGIKGAPSYFQQAMSGVLRDLLYKVCELYLDDIIVYGRTKEEFTFNLNAVLTRLEEHGITLSPSKCQFGMTEVEYLGHVINQHGMNMSQTKKNKVLDFPQPQYAKQLKSFLGLANYFRDHIRNFSDKVKPLNHMLVNYTRTRKLTWSIEATEAFERIKTAIGDCPTLYFMDTQSPVFLHTDASDYGIGAYLFQVVDGEERPAAFISKTLSETQLRWSTIEKEAYAIFYALTQLQHLIRDRFFTLRTDHNNLTYLNVHPSAKVLRWKLAIQEYDFAIEHIPGKHNHVADNMSRLCASQKPPKSKHNKEPNTLSSSTKVVAHALASLVPIDVHYVYDDSIRVKIPQDKYYLLGQVHSSKVGHHGFERTYAKLQAKGKTWDNMRAHIRQFIRQCPICQKLSYIKVPIQTHPFTVSSYAPMDKINIDYLGHFPTDPDGYRYIMVVVDCFTRFVELYPAKACDGESAAYALHGHMGRYGTPSMILSDKGHEFVNSIHKSLASIAGYENITTTAYSKQENSIVERTNREVLRHLQAIVYDVNIKSNWRRCLPIVQRILNASWHSAINCSPAQLLFGNAIQLEERMYSPVKQDRDSDIRLSEWTSDMLKKQAEIIRIAQKTLQTRDEAHLLAKKPRGQITEYPINSYVLVSYPSTNSMGRPPSKLHTRWRGPLRVVDSKGSAYTLMNLVTNKQTTVHISQLKPFEYDPNTTDPREVANHDYDEFDVEEILNHEGSPKKKTEMQFLVRWLGYGPDDDLWLPWSELRSNEALHTYLRQHNMESLIPKSFR